MANDPYDRERYDRDRGDPRERGFFDRAGDELRSWFGDEEAERRRRQDERHDDRGAYARDPYGSGSYPRSNRDEGGRGYPGSGPHAAPYARAGEGQQFGDPDRQARGYGHAGGHQPQSREPFGTGRDDHYRAAWRGGRDRGERYAQDDGYRDWRDQQIDSFDRDYAEYRRENQQRFHSEFAAWRQNRQTQRDSLGQVKEHQEVVGSDGAHVGTVDHVRSDHILLTRTDPAANGHHHAIPSSWIASVGEKVTLGRTAEEARRQWQDAETRGGLFGGDDRDGDRRGGNLNRSFSGTY